MSRPLPRAAPDLWALPERGVGDRVERVVERTELAGDENEPFMRLEATVDSVEPVGDPVEPLEQCVELAIRDVDAIHLSILRVELWAIPEPRP